MFCSALLCAGVISIAIPAAHSAPAKKSTAAKKSIKTKTVSKASSRSLKLAKHSSKAVLSKKRVNGKMMVVKSVARNEKTSVRGLKLAAGKHAKIFKIKGKTVQRVAVRTMMMVRGKRKMVTRFRTVAYAPPAPPVLSMGERAGLRNVADPLDLKSSVALVMEQDSTKVLFEKNADVPLPIASITKLMTAMVVLDAGLRADEVLFIGAADIDTEKRSTSRLSLGSTLTRDELLLLALMSSENRAASALGRHYPGGIEAFVRAMNAKARALGMEHTQFNDSTGLSSQNRASARDLGKMVNAAFAYSKIRQYSTTAEHSVMVDRGLLDYRNSNALVKNPDWKIGLQKTGYISEAGRCLVMQATIEQRPVVMVFLDSQGRYSRLGDAARVRKWLEDSTPTHAALSKQASFNLAQRKLH